MTNRLSFLAHLAGCVLGLSAAAGQEQQATGQESWAVNPEAEKWVRQEVAAGRPADLRERFVEKHDRVLSANFLRELLSNPPGDPRLRHYIVRIRHGVVADPVDLTNLPFEDEIWLVGFEVHSDFNLAQSHFKRQLSLDGTAFTSRKAVFDFGNLRVDGTFFMRGTKFASGVDVRHGRFGTNVEAHGALFTNPNGLRLKAYFYKRPSLCRSAEFGCPRVDTLPIAPAESEHRRHVTRPLREALSA